MLWLVVVKETVLYVRVFINVLLLLLLCALITCDVQTTTISLENRLKNYYVTCENITVPVCYDQTRPDQFMLLILYSRVTVSHFGSFWPGTWTMSTHAKEKQTISQKVL